MYPQSQEEYEQMNSDAAYAEMEAQAAQAEAEAEQERIDQMREEGSRVISGLEDEIKDLYERIEDLRTQQNAAYQFYNL